jgi:hypothetical protein
MATIDTLFYIELSFSISVIIAHFSINIEIGQNNSLLLVRGTFFYEALKDGATFLWGYLLFDR